MKTEHILIGMLCITNVLAIALAAAALTIAQAAKAQSDKNHGLIFYHTTNLH